MTTKSTLLLLATAAALFAFIYFVEWPLREAALKPPSRKILPDLDPAKITGIEIDSGGHIIRVEKSNDLWRLTTPVAYPANIAVVEKFLQGLSQWDGQSVLGPNDLTNHPNALEEFGLDPPQATILVRDNQQERVLNIGYISPVGDQVYINLSGSTLINIASADLVTNTPGDPDRWRNLAVLDLANTPYERLEVRSANSTFNLTRDPGSRLWEMTAPVQHRADTTKIDALLARLQDLSVSNFVQDGAPELDASLLQGTAASPLLELKFLPGGGATNAALDLQVGASPTNNPKLAYIRRHSPANVIEIAKEPLLPWEASYTNFLDYHLTSLSPDSINSIEVSGGDKFTVQKIAGNAWTVAGPENFPADELLMRGWLSALTNINVSIPFLNEADLAPYGLNNPFLQFQINYAPAAGATNQPAVKLLFGQATNQNGLIYERRPDENAVNAISLEQFSRLPWAYWQLRDRSIWNFETNEVLGIDVRQKGDRRSFRRDADNHWRLALGSETGFAPEAVEETVYQMGRLRAIYWSGVGEDHLERFGFDAADFQISFKLQRDGKLQTNTIVFGGASPNLHPYASVMRNGQRLEFEFPLDLYQMVTQFLGVPAGAAALR